jgi:hypothetical protein
LFVGAIIGDDAPKDKNKAASGRCETTGQSTAKRTCKKKRAEALLKPLPAAFVMPAAVPSAAVTVSDNRSTITVVAGTRAEATAIHVTNQPYLFDIGRDVGVCGQADGHG